MMSPIFIALDGKLENRNVSLGIHKYQRCPCPMVNPSFIVLNYGLESSTLKKRLHSPCNIWSSWRCVSQLASIVKTTIILADVQLQQSEFSLKPSKMPETSWNLSDRGRIKQRTSCETKRSKEKFNNIARDSPKNENM